MRYVLSNSNNNSDSDLIDHPFPISLSYHLVELLWPITKQDFWPLHKMHYFNPSPTLPKDFDQTDHYVYMFILLQSTTESYGEQFNMEQ